MANNTNTEILLARLIGVIDRLDKNLDRIATALEKSIPEKPAPNYRLNIDKFPTFDWSSIDAVVEKGDKYGASIVLWDGKRFARRSPDNSYGTDIWFSRACGRQPDGRVKYERLITFSKPEEKKIRAIWQSQRFAPSREAEDAIGY
ncbi:single-stranded DNA-binding protein [Pannus brasiliensis CCIBt3594]|uniref:Single-stranded DNA-binding protein n=1 Tax=Pannus brasiliensis CCIBt3594 TaxID=1427578 RepID=A0AAW9QZW7_9CHRO